MKISIIGAGRVGATAALYIMQKELGDIVLVDIRDTVKGIALDLNEAAPILRSDSKVTGTTAMQDIKGSDVVVVTAGLPRGPGMSRDDLLKKNAAIVSGICKQIKQYAPKAIVIMVTNPLDVMTYLAVKIIGDPKRVMGMAGILDSVRLRSFIANALDVSIKDIEALVLGGHGDSMVPLMDHTTVSGIQVTKLLSESKLDKITQRTRGGGGEIIQLGGGSAYYAPAAAITEMVEAIAKDNNRILPVSVLLNGQYGYKDVCLGVPLELGKEGVKKIVKLDLSAKAKKLLDESAKTTKNHIKEAKRLVKI